jgi:transposase-like protein
MSLPEFQKLYGNEEQCEPALAQARWPDGIRYPRCGEQEHGLINGRRHRRYQCRNCRHQATVAAGTIMEATKLPLPKWFLSGFLLGAESQASTSELDVWGRFKTGPPQT